MKLFSHNIVSVIKILRKETANYQLPIVTKVALKEKDPFWVLISCILSLRTKDETTTQATKRLIGLGKTPKEILRLPLGRIEKAIYPVGFYRTKANNIKKICEILLKDFASKVPSDLEVLLTLPGVGRKTANLVLTLGFNKLGICVDTHVHRISNRLGYIKTKDPEQTEFVLRKHLPKRYWIEYNDLLVAWGQNICRPTSPLCSKCKIVSFCSKNGVKHSR